MLFPSGSFRYFCRRGSLYQQPRSHLWFCCCNSSRIPCVVRKTHRLPKWPNFVNIVPFEPIVRYLLVSEQDAVRCFRQCSKEATDLFLGVLPTNTQLEREMSIGREAKLSYVFFVFEKDTEIIVTAKNGMGSESLKKHFVHGNSLLEHRQIFAERRREKELLELETSFAERTLPTLVSSCRILLWSGRFHCRSVSGVSPAMNRNPAEVVAVESKERKQLQGGESRHCYWRLDRRIRHFHCNDRVTKWILHVVGKHWIRILGMRLISSRISPRHFSFGHRSQRDVRLLSYEQWISLSPFHLTHRRCQYANRFHWDQRYQRVSFRCLLPLHWMLPNDNRTLNDLIFCPFQSYLPTWWWWWFFQVS